MSPRYFRDESELFNRVTQQRAFIGSYQGDEELARRVVAQRNTWPQNDPGVVLSLAKDGRESDDPLAAEVARLSQQRKAKKGFWDKGIGSVIRAGAGMVGEVIDKVDDPILTGIKGTTRVATTALAAPFEELQGGIRSLAGTIGGRPGGLAAGAAAGAGIGAGLGVVGGPLAPITAPIGAAIGGVIGGVAGFLGGDEIESKDPGFRWQSTAAQAIGQLREKGEADLGSGFIPGGEAHKEQVRRAQQAASIKGHALTPGRLVATSVAEPGTTPYNFVSGLVDFAGAIKLDPVAVGGLKKAQIHAARKTILPEKVAGFLDSADGAKMVTALTDNRSAYDIWSLSKGQISVESSVRLANNTSPDEVRRILQSELGTNVRTKFKPQISRTKRALHGVPGSSRVRRVLQDMPAETLDFDDPHGFIQGIDSFQNLARVPKEVRLANNDKIMQALARPDQQGRLDAVKAVESSIGDVLVARGMDESTAKQMVRMVDSNTNDARMYTAAEIAEDSAIPGMVINDDGVRIAAPSLVSELLDSVHIPNRQTLRDIRTQATRMAPLMRSPAGKALRGSDIFMTGAMNKVWKAGVLLRLAIVPRVAGEEQIRMAAAGYDSVFSHPLSTIMRLTGRRGRTGFEGETIMDARAAQEALSGRQHAAGFLETGGRQNAIVGKHRQQYIPGEDGYRQGWLNHELGHLRGDQIAQHQARHGAEATKDWLWNGAGRKFLNTLRQSQPDNPNFLANELDVARYVDDVVGKRISDMTQGDQRLIDYIGQGRRTGQAEKAATKKANGVLKEMEEAGVRPEKVVGDLLIEGGEGAGAQYDKVVTTLFGFLMERPTNFLNRSRTFEQAYWKRGEEIVSALTPDAQQVMLANARKANLPAAQIKRLEQRIAESGPQVGRYTDKELRGLAARGRTAQTATAEDLIDETLGVIPETGPAGYGRKKIVTEEGVHGEVFSYRDKDGRLVGTLSVEVDDAGKAVNLSVGVLPAHQRKGIATELFARAEKAGFDVEAVSGVGGLTSEGAAFALTRRAQKGLGKLDLAHADEYAKAFALEEVRTLLYDLSKKGLWADSARIVAPFAEPWKEMLTTWGKLANPVANPYKTAHLARRATQTVEGARGEVLGGEGFFYTDEQTGEEMFVYPGSEFISKIVTGAPIPFRGRVAGLNLFAQNPVLPGAGPLVQIAAGTLLPEKPEFDWLQDAINPFGRGEEDGLAERLLFPAAWIDKLKKVTADPESDRMFGNAVMDSARYLVSTGEFSINSPEEQQRTSEAAVSMARRVYFLRAVGSFALPAAPSPEFLSAIPDDDGKAMTMWQLMDDFQKLQDNPEIGYDDAVAVFLDRYGEEALLYMQPKTEGGAPPVEDLLQWSREHPEAADRFPDVYQYFGPATGEFSFTAYERQLASGERKPIKPEEAQRLANSRVASMRWRQVKDKIGPRPNAAQKQWLDQIKSGLLEEYPGWEPEVFKGGVIANKVRHLQEALEMPELASTETGGALKLYFAARDKAVETAKAAGFSNHAKAKAMQPVREWLRSIADTLAEQRPAFADVYERVLEREMTDDTPTVAEELPSGEEF